MKHRLVTISLSTLLLSWGTSHASHRELSPPTPVPASAAEAIVQKALVQPLEAQYRDRPRFSRGALPPRAMRLRVLDAEAKVDSAGGRFARFAIDECHGLGSPTDLSDCKWQEAALSGCVYPETGGVFVTRGYEALPAAAMLGKRVGAAPAQTCHATT